MEQEYYEMADRDNIEFVNSPIVELTEQGIRTEEW